MNRSNTRIIMFREIQYALIFDNFEHFCNLIDNIIDVDKKDCYDRTFLECANYGETLKAMKYLIDKGADINARDEQGNTALILVASNAWFDLFGTYSSNLDVVKYLVDHGADVNAQNEEGDTALMNALKWNNPEVAEYLKGIKE